jgi:hypothetical protein
MMTLLARHCAAGYNPADSCLPRIGSLAALAAWLKAPGSAAATM